ncbi:hypothetical protein GCM10009609_10170 [Pseudonocardia aurantiaca]
MSFVTTDVPPPDNRNDEQEADMDRLLDGKNAIIYGAGGLGGGVARVFAREGAAVTRAA